MSASSASWCCASVFFDQAERSQTLRNLIGRDDVSSDVEMPIYIRKHFVLAREKCRLQRQRRDPQPGEEPQQSLFGIIGIQRHIGKGPRVSRPRVDLALEWKQHRQI